MKIHSHRIIGTMCKSLLDIIKEKGLKPSDIAKQLDISTSQIYQWNKKGISQNNPHYYKLKEIIPEIIPKEPKLRLDEKYDLRSGNSRPKKELILKDTDIPSYQEKEFKSKLHPKINFKDEWGLPYVPVDKRDNEWYEKRKNLPKIERKIKW